MAFYLRTMMILAAFAQGIFIDDAYRDGGAPGFDFVLLAIVFLMTAFFSIFGGSLGVLFEGRGTSLLKPGLSVPLFARQNPLQICYFPGFLFLAAGLGLTLRGIWNGFLLDGFLVMGAGLGLLMGCRVVMRLFRRRFVDEG